MRLPLILAVLGIAALLASACGEGGSAEPAKTLEVELPTGAALLPTVIPSPTPCPPEGCPTLSEVKKLTASDARGGDHFGSSVAVSGDTAIVGSGFRDVAYVFERDQGGPSNWGEAKKLTARAGDAFGVSVAVSGDTAVVGAPVAEGGRSDTDAAYVFQRDEGGPGNWGEVTKLTGSDAQAGDFFGSSVAISGDTVAVGASFAVYLFQRDEGGPGNWAEVTKLTATDAQAYHGFGNSVAISGDTALVGASGEGGDLDAAYVFQRDHGGADNWGEVKKLTASDAQVGDGPLRLAVSGGTAIVGAHAEDARAGAAHVFERD